MEVILSSAEMRACDRFAISRLRIPGLILMENAGRSVVEAIRRYLGTLSGKRFLICCGTGNNGGDGFVVARHLLNAGATVQLALAGTGKTLKGDARTNFDVLMALRNSSGRGSGLTILEQITPSKLLHHPVPDAIVDALFGTGYSGIPREPFRGLIDAINRLSVPTFSIDVPSGLDSDTGSVASVAVKATVTVTLAALKPGLLVGDSSSFTGRIELGDISIPGHAIAACATERIFRVSKGDIAGLLPLRSRTAHKHSVGKIFVLAGSPGMTGAAALASQAALRIGAGAVILGTPASVHEILARKLTEVMVSPLEETEDGTIGERSLALIQRHMSWADVVVIGPGLGRNQTTQGMIHEWVKKRTRPTLLDADGLNAFERMDLKRSFSGKTDLILTPHTGECSRLCGVDPNQIEQNRISIAREFAKRNRVTLVLKGAPTIASDQKGGVYINSTGNAGMATAGSGDVLSGCIGGLVGQGMSALDAALAGVFIHGFAGDLAKEEFGERSLLAGDIMRMLPPSILAIEKGRRG
jgi:NAD(P)H-hydrate epimerase